MSKNLFLLFSSIILLILASCNLSDFQTDKLVKPKDLSPVVYLPVAVGNYIVKDFYTLPPGPANLPFVLPSISFVPIPISYSLDQLNFVPTAVDSMFIVVKTVNETPMKLQYTFEFNGAPPIKSDILQSAKLNSSGDVIEPAKDSIEYKLNAQEIIELGSSPSIDLYITLFQPDMGTVFSGVLKSSKVSFKIGFRAPINMVKIKL